MAAANASVMRPATNPSGVPSATVIRATPPMPGITSAKNPRRVAAD